MLAASTLRAGLHEQDSGTMDSHLLVVSGVSSYLHSETEMNPNERAAYATPTCKAKRTVTSTPKYNTKPSTEEYKQLRLLLPQCCLPPQLLFILSSSSSACSPPEHVPDASVIRINPYFQSC